MHIIELKGTSGGKAKLGLINIGMDRVVGLELGKSEFGPNVLLVTLDCELEEWRGLKE